MAWFRFQGHGVFFCVLFYSKKYGVKLFDFKLRFYFLLGSGWSEVSSEMAFHWPVEGMLCGTAIFPDDCETYLHSWA